MDGTCVRVSVLSLPKADPPPEPSACHPGAAATGRPHVGDSRHRWQGARVIS
jgi:hypothetical protein